MSLDTQTALITGGAGEVGEGIVRQFLRAGATVIVPSRNEERLNQLRTLLANEDTDRLITKQADISSIECAEALRDEIDELHHVVASLGGWWQGKPIVELDLATWHQVIDNGLTAHFIAARTFLPVIASQAGSSYTMINGGGALNPVPGSGLVSISAAAQIMLQKVLAAEHQSQPVRVNTLLLATPVKTRARTQTAPEWVSADDAGKYCVYLAQSDTDGETIIFSNSNQTP